MKILKYGKETFGVILTAKTQEERRVLRRLFDGGAKVNVYVTGKEHDELEITFSDLIGGKYKQI